MGGYKARPAGMGVDMMFLLKLAGLVSFVLGQSQHCVDGGVCFTLLDLGNKVEIQFEYPEELGWVALGMGVWMQGSDMVIAWQGTDGVIVSDRKAFNYLEPKVDPIQDYRLNSSSTEGGKTRIKIHRLKDTGDINDAIITNEPTDYIWAYSKIRPASSVNAKLETHEDSGKFNLGLSSGQATDTSSTLIKIIHGLLLFLGWNLFPYLGILAAGPLRPKLGRHWFRIHYALLGLLAPGLVVAGVAIIFAQKLRHFTTLHEILGLVVMIAMLLQIALGVTIHLTWNPARTKVPWQDKLHWWVGRLVFLLAQINIVLGLLQYKNPSSLIPIWVIYPLLLLAEIILYTLLQNPSLLSRHPKDSYINKEDIK